MDRATGLGRIDLSGKAGDLGEVPRSDLNCNYGRTLAAFLGEPKGSPMLNCDRASSDPPKRGEPNESAMIIVTPFHYYVQDSNRQSTTIQRAP